MCGEMWCGEFVNAAGCYVAETGREREREWARESMCGERGKGRGQCHTFPLDRLN